MHLEQKDPLPFQYCLRGQEESLEQWDWHLGGQEEALELELAVLLWAWSGPYCKDSSVLWSC